MPYGNPIRLSFGGSAGIEAGQIAPLGYTNLLRHSELLTVASSWSLEGGATVAPVTLASDLPVGGRTAFRVTDTSAVVASAIAQGRSVGGVNFIGGGANRPLIFSFYCVLEGYVQNQARAEAEIFLANLNTINFTADFNPQNGQLISTNFATTEPGFLAAETSAFVQFFEGEQGVSAVRISLVVFTRGLTGPSALDSAVLRVFPDVADPTSVGRFIDITACQIAVPFGEISTQDLGLLPYVPTWGSEVASQAAKIPGNALDLAFHTGVVVANPYTLDWYADLGKLKIVPSPGPPNQEFILPTDSGMPIGWWTLLGGESMAPFDLTIAAGQSLSLGDASPAIPGPATVTITPTNTTYYMLISFGAGGSTWQIVPFIQRESGGGGGGGGPVSLPFVGTANTSAIHGIAGAAETSLTPTGIGSVTIPAGSLVVGRSYRLTAEGGYITHPVTATGGGKLRLRSNGVLLAESPRSGFFAAMGPGIGALPSINAPWRCIVDFTCRAVGVGGSLSIKGDWGLTTTPSELSMNIFFGFGNDIVTTVPFDTTIAQTLDLTFAYGSAIGNLGTIFTLTNFTLEALTT